MWRRKLTVFRVCLYMSELMCCQHFEQVSGSTYQEKQNIQWVICSLKSIVQGTEWELILRKMLNVFKWKKCANFSFIAKCHQGSVQFSCSVMSDSLRLHELQNDKASLSITNSQSLLRLMSIASVKPSNHLILCRPLLLLPSIFPSIGVFSNEPALHIRWPKYWSFSFSNIPSKEIPGLIMITLIPR